MKAKGHGPAMMRPSYSSSDSTMPVMASTAGVITTASTTAVNVVSQVFWRKPFGIHPALIIYPPISIASEAPIPTRRSLRIAFSLLESTYLHMRRARQRDLPQHEFPSDRSWAPETRRKCNFGGTREKRASNHGAAPAPLIRLPPPGRAVGRQQPWEAHGHPRLSDPETQTL